MGVTIHYRGTINDLRLVEKMEDRVLDLVAAFGGTATIWRSFADHDSSRVVRGVIVELEPGQESLSLLISPEGYLTPLILIEESEKTPFDEPPCCSVKTQFGSLQGHIAAVFLFDALKRHFFSDLYVNDEGGYFQNRNVAELQQNMGLLDSVINAFSKQFQVHSISPEAAEDPEILATRIERIAALIHRNIANDQPPATRLSPADIPLTNPWNSDNTHQDQSSLDDQVARITRLQRELDHHSERMARRISEATAAGMSIEDAVALAIAEARRQTRQENPEKPWTDDSPKQLFASDHLYTDDSHAEDFGSEDTFTEDPDDSTAEASLSPSSNPTTELAYSFVLYILRMKPRLLKPSSFMQLLERSSFDILQGLLRATHRQDEDAQPPAILISQLKKTLSAHAYARGAVFGLHSHEAITAEDATKLHQDLAALLETTQKLLADAW